MGYHPRFECRKRASFLTTRSRNSELWFVNNKNLEQAILGYAARYRQRRNVKLYALAIEGNHIQTPAHFPEANRADFMRDLNSSVARSVARLAPEYPGGRFWERRYSAEIVPDEDLEKQFFYTVLQPVQDGLVERISQYPGYNCFNDAVKGIKRKFRVVNWAKYNAAKRYKKRIRIKDYIDTYELVYERLPGYEDLSQKEYETLMRQKLEEKRLEIVRKRKAEGKGFAGREALLKTVPGSIPRNTKTSTIDSHRPRALSDCPQRRKEALEWYFAMYSAYKEASMSYRAGDLNVEFPEGTYRPHLFHPPPT